MANYRIDPERAYDEGWALGWEHCIREAHGDHHTSDEAARLNLYDVVNGGGINEVAHGEWWLGYYHARAAYRAGDESGRRKAEHRRIVAAVPVGITEIAMRLSVVPGTVRMWRTRHADFPAPMAELAMGPVWDWGAVLAWSRRLRPRGRPAKG